MNTYMVVVAESMPRCCEIEIAAEDEESAVAAATEMWENGELDNSMENSNDGPDFLNAYVLGSEV